MKDSHIEIRNKLFLKEGSVAQGQVGQREHFVGIQDAANEARAGWTKLLVTVQPQGGVWS